MSYPTKSELYEEIRARVTKDRLLNPARKELHYQFSADGWDNEDVDYAVTIADKLYTYFYEQKKFNDDDAFDDAVDNAIQYCSAVVAAENDRIWNAISPELQDAAHDILEEMKDIISGGRRRRERSRSNRSSRYDDDYDDDYDERRRGDRSRHRERRRNDYDDRPRRRGQSNRARNEYEARRSSRGGRGRDPIESRGEAIGRGSSMDHYYDTIDRAEKRQRRVESAEGQVENVFRNRQDNPVRERAQPAPVQEQPKESRVLQYTHDVRFDPSNQIAHTLFDAEKHYPLYLVDSVEQTVVGEQFILKTSEAGQILSRDAMDHRNYLFLRRRGSNNATSTDTEKANEIYNRLAQTSVTLESHFDRLIMDSGTVVAKEGAEFPEIMKRVPVVVEDTLDIDAEISGDAKLYTLVEYVNRCLTPLNPSFDYNQMILIGTVVEKLPFRVAHLTSNDLTLIKNSRENLSNRNNLSSVIDFLKLLERTLGLREWNIINDHVTQAFNDIATIEYGIPDGIDSFTTQVRDYIEAVSQGFGRRVAESLSDQMQRIVESTLLFNFDDDVLAVESATMIVLLPITSCDVTIGLAHANDRTGIVSAELHPHLHIGLDKVLRNAPAEIRRICIYTRDEEMVTLHRAPLTDAILLHRPH